MKRLTLDKRNAKICGVCAGVANYFEIDPTVVRLVVGLTFCCFGVGVVPYIAAAIILPEG